MAREKVDRVPLSVRPLRTIYDPFLVLAKQRGLSVAAAVEDAMRAWAKLPTAEQTDRRDLANARRAVASTRRPNSVRELSMSLVRPGPPFERKPIPKQGKKP